VHHVNVDTTVQTKDIRHPTDARLYDRARQRLVKEARREGLRIKQSYERVGRRLVMMAGRYAHARQMRRSKACVRKLRTNLGRVIREIERQGVPPNMGDLLATSLERNGYGDLKRQFIVETHSEALLLRLMRRIRETTKEIVSNGPRLLCDHVAVYHISKQDGNSIAKKIELDTYGNLTDEWPDDLFEIGYKERFGE
jgi:hypothetical protein